jgi:hypothetical protein
MLARQGYPRLALFLGREPGMTCAGLFQSRERSKMPERYRHRLGMARVAVMCTGLALVVVLH